MGGEDRRVGDAVEQRLVDVGATDRVVLDVVTGQRLIENLAGADRVGGEIEGSDLTVLYVPREDRFVDDVRAADRVGGIGDAAGQDEKEREKARPLISDVRAQSAHLPLQSG